MPSSSVEVEGWQRLVKWVGQDHRPSGEHRLAQPISTPPVSLDMFNKPAFLTLEHKVEHKE